MTQNNILLDKAKALKLYGVIAHFDEIATCDWIANLISWEELERNNRNNLSRLKNARLGQFKPLADFDWNWPKKIDRELIEELMQLDFIKKSMNVVLCGPNGVGKSTIAQNIAYQAAVRGFSVLFTSAADMLNDLASCESDISLQRTIKHYLKPQLLVVDEVGYLSYSNRHADLFFEIISKRYNDKSIIVTTNKPFSAWTEIFQNASCVVSLIDRLVHHAEITGIEAPSFRLKEAEEQAQLRKKARAERNKNKKNNVEAPCTPI